MNLLHKKVLQVILFSLLFSFGGLTSVRAIDYTDTSAISIIGQPDFLTNVGRNKGMNSPTSIEYAGGKLFIGIYGHCGIHVLNSLPTSSHPFFDFAIGEPNVNTSCTLFNIATSQNTGEILGITSTATKLIVLDGGHNRALIYNTIPTSDNPVADVVIGQPNFTTGTANTGGISASTLSYVSNPLFTGDIYTDGTKLYIADGNNNRVLIWNTIPTLNNTPADVVLGQPNFTTGTINTGGVSASSMKNPRGVIVINGKLVVSDGSNNRILIWNSVPTVSSTPADVVIGQPDFISSTGNNGGIAGNRLYSPSKITSYNGKMLVSDLGNNRVLIWNSVPADATVSADLVLGQPDFVTSATGTTQNGLYYPLTAEVVGGKIYIADSYNHRVVVHNSFPTSNNANANLVLGHADFVRRNYNDGGDYIFNAPYHHIAADGKFLVADGFNHRILIWNSIPTTKYPLNPDVVIGQPNMNSAVVNYGGRSSSSLNVPYNINSCNGKMVVADYSNHRVLIWNSIPTSNLQGADVVIGQPDFASATANNGGRSAKSLNAPFAVNCIGSKMLISDTGNKRVLVFNSIPTTDFKEADVVIGQPDFISATSNNGGISNKSLTNIYGQIGSNGTNLMIPDSNNNRVLIFNTVPTTNFKEADVVIGQPDFVTATANNGGRSNKSINAPRGAYSDGQRLFVVDGANHRVLGWNSIPTSNFQEADFVIGQPDFTSAEENISATKLYKPMAVSTYNGKVYVSDENNRITIFPFGAQNEEVEIPGATTTTNITVDLSADGAKEMLVSQRSDFVGASWETYDTSKDITISSTEGTKTVYVKYKDYADYEGSVLSASTVYDISSPVANMYFLSPTSNGYTNSVNVQIAMNGNDPLSGLSKMLVSADSSFSGAVWETYSNLKSWVLTSGDGVKTVYAKFKDVAGNVSGVYSANITLDTAEADLTIDMGDDVKVVEDKYYVGVLPTLSGTGEIGSEVTIKLGGEVLGTTIVGEDGTWSWTATEAFEDGEYALLIELTDEAGNKASEGMTIVVEGESQGNGTPQKPNDSEDTDDKTTNEKEGITALGYVGIGVGLFLLFLIFLFFKKRKTQS
ncbi:MAG: Conserved repeat domain protein [candidate division WS6 bacterium GW2011_GWF1_35_23]|uniref:Conserved repeat domain protein n=1 Tax=candidate division WS6 bacterium GW2011_GWF1_35_23 TaxID=1619097 RepID=A0A0G0EJQ3_9BACT|nr:MAG: Conserved repeat domain protein [candidate division WS6 bacterium GW2011_GWF1_35_23]